jgi:hypothetical protein
MIHFSSTQLNSMVQSSVNTKSDTFHQRKCGLNITNNVDGHVWKIIAVLKKSLQGKNVCFNWHYADASCGLKAIPSCAQFLYKISRIVYEKSREEYLGCFPKGAVIAKSGLCTSIWELELIEYF